MQQEEKTREDVIWEISSQIAELQSKLYRQHNISPQEGITIVINLLAATYTNVIQALKPTTKNETILRHQVSKAIVLKLKKARGVIEAMHKALEKEHAQRQQNP